MELMQREREARAQRRVQRQSTHIANGTPGDGEDASRRLRTNRRGNSQGSEVDGNLNLDVDDYQGMETAVPPTPVTPITPLAPLTHLMPLVESDVSEGDMLSPEARSFGKGMDEFSMEAVDGGSSTDDFTSAAPSVDGIDGAELGSPGMPTSPIPLSPTYSPSYANVIPSPVPRKGVSSKGVSWAEEGEGVERANGDDGDVVMSPTSEASTPVVRKAGATFSTDAPSELAVDDVGGLLTEDRVEEPEGGSPSNGGWRATPVPQDVRNGGVGLPIDEGEDYDGFKMGEGAAYGGGEDDEDDSYDDDMYDDDDDLDDEDDDDDGEDDEDDDSEDMVMDSFAEESKNLLTLLYSIAEDQARKDGYVHRSITCNHCGSSPVRGFRFKCANCVDFDLCEACEAADVHPRTHVFLKIRIPIPPHANPRSALLNVFYPGKSISEVDPGSIDFTALQKITHFDIVELQAFYEQFRSLATVEDTDTAMGGITREVFEQCLGPLGLEKNLITERIFAFFDQDGDRLISFQELVKGLSILCKGSLDERIKYAFQGYDIDGDGVISREELHRMFKAYFYLSMELVRDFVKIMEEGMMETFDDEASKPVSASFAAPIQGNGGPNDDDEGTKEDPSAMSVPTTSNSGALVINSTVASSSSAAASSHHHGASSSSSNSAGPRVGSGAVMSAGSRRKGKRPASMNETELSGNILLGPSFATASSSSGPSAGTPFVHAASSSGQPNGGATNGASNATVTSPLATLPPLAGNTMLPLPPPAAAQAPLSGVGTTSTASSNPTAGGGGMLTRGTRALQEHQLRRRSNTNLRGNSVGRGMHGINTDATSAGITMPPSPVLGLAQSPGGMGLFEEALHAAEGGEEQHWPVIEAMSQDAIEEMVEKTFAAAGAESPNFITLDEFKRAVESDHSYLQWFEALGSVF
ncbi:hypothetical protein HK101_009347 [Irineochytrium annulatum]|nr:hypothetical protein HK101_009347 [Irineochytrium annulatum]